MPRPKLMKAGSPDHFQTDPEALDCLLPYIPMQWRIWECAAGKGNLVNALQGIGRCVTGTDISYTPSIDFLKCELPETHISPINCIITNPPYSLKEEFLARCYQLGKPFALLMPLTTFDSIERRTLFQQHGTTVIFPRRRINFETPNHEKNVAAGKRTNSWFYTAWFTWGLQTGLKQLIFNESNTLDI